MSLHRLHKSILSACTVLCLTLLAAAAIEGSWSSRVPDKDRDRANPYETDTQAVLVGRKLFQQHCASCHGSSAEGKGKRPNLHSDTVRKAKAGELQWLLTNGNLAKGMPSWSRLPEQQRWQLVTYLRSLE
jgi:mono/diheme cytochrome c family protein